VKVLSILVALLLISAACGDTTDEPTASAEPPGTTEPPSTAAPETAAPPTTVAPATTQVPATTQPAFEPAPFVTLDDGTLAMEPANTSYRATLLFTMTATLSDGNVQEGTMVADGGKIVDTFLDTVTHSFVVDVEGLVDLPDCIDIAALSPTWVSVYDTFYGGDAGDLTGDALLAEAGIMNNGVLVDRYAITLDNIKPEESNEYASLTEAYVDVARPTINERDGAVRGGYLVSLVLNGTGFNNTFTVDQSEPRDIVFELDFLEFDTITEFTVPEGCVTP
jgi:hypothetical protein